jgi:hypothetical protein
MEDPHANETKHLIVIHQLLYQTSVGIKISTISEKWLASYKGLTKAYITQPKSTISLRFTYKLDNGGIMPTGPCALDTQHHPTS